MLDLNVWVAGDIKRTCMYSASAVLCLLYGFKFHRIHNTMAVVELCDFLVTSVLPLRLGLSVLVSFQRSGFFSFDILI